MSRMNILRDHALRSNAENLRRARRSPTWFSRAATTNLDTVDRENRTINAVIATENPVVFYDYGSRRVMREVLVAAGGRLSPWVPLLNSHQSWDLQSSLGSVLESKMIKAEITARLQFSSTADVDPIWQRVRDGHLRMISIGGRRLTFTDIEPGQSAEIAGRRWVAGKQPLRVTTQWIQREASVVIFGADGGASTDI
ncbi:hypothetical protein [Allorhodopirellula heiligendammensis]|uniref:Uncharacterized protein n=1 Tax=Allorhodopirellula heiligendammensis TaxID=2714739 RepID=A0A5C6BV79_9BACT|nr:hypothetical protein [Allorhodopirellula heiligendammensis]TWU15968.1 hypothetical protein Poly21_31720 [Allorhodopirellula heiligendammensis]